MSLEVTLEPCWELRYEVLPTDRPAKIQLIPESNKFAEMGGVEMAPGRLYEVPPGTSGSIYTWHGCSLKVQHLPDDQVYTAEAHVMQHFAHAHSILEEKRRAARQQHEKGELGAEGPRALVCGAPSSGKQSLCNVLVNYAARLDWQTTFADLDVACNSIAVPGAVAAVPVDMPVPVEEGFALFPPISFFYGDKHLDEKGYELYHLQVAALAEKVNERHANNDKARSGGVVVKAMSTRQTAKDVLRAVRDFRIGHIFVLGDDKLHAQLRAALTRESLEAELVQLPRSGGCITKTDKQRDFAMSRHIHSYFHGWSHMQLHPHSYTITDTDKVDLVSIGGTLKMQMDGLLPIGEDSALTPTDPRKVPPSKRMEQTIVGFSQASSYEEAATAPVFGFGIVLSVNTETKQMQLLIPMLVKELPTKVIVVGEVRSYNDR